MGILGILGILGFSLGVFLALCHSMARRCEELTSYVFNSVFVYPFQSS